MKIVPIVSAVPDKQTIVIEKTSEIEKTRIYYIDKLRLWLTILVIIHHCFFIVMFGWSPYYRPRQIYTANVLVSYLFLSANQAYFMGLFFFLAGLVFGPSLKRKGMKVFVKDRFIRLIVPALVYTFVLSPLLYWFADATWYGPQRGYSVSAGDVWAYFYQNFNSTQFSHMWFTVTLFAFSLIAICILCLVKSWREFACSSQQTMKPLTRMQMFWLQTRFATILFILNCAVRLGMPHGHIWIPIFANLGFVFQYSVAFVAGILANSYKFLDQINKKYLATSLATSIACYFFFEVAQILGPFLGFYGFVILTSFFEQFFAVFWSFTLLVYFKEYQNAPPSNFTARLIAAAYSAYILHAWIVVPLTVALAYTNLYPLVVFLILAIPSVLLSMLLALLVKSIPGSHLIL
jgi:hypothetical protein